MYKFIFTSQQVSLIISCITLVQSS